MRATVNGVIIFVYTKLINHAAAWAAIIKNSWSLPAFKVYFKSTMGCVRECRYIRGGPKVRNRRRDALSKMNMTTNALLSTGNEGDSNDCGLRTTITDRVLLKWLTATHSA